MYPLAMLKGREVDWVALEFEINERGRVENPVVTDAYEPGVFELSAIQAIMQFKYEPKCR